MTRFLGEESAAKKAFDSDSHRKSTGKMNWIKGSQFSNDYSITIPCKREYHADGQGVGTNNVDPNTMQTLSHDSTNNNATNNNLQNQQNQQSGGTNGSDNASTGTSQNNPNLNPNTNPLVLSHKRGGKITHCDLKWEMMNK